MTLTNEKRKRLIRIKHGIAARRPKFIQVESWRYVRIPPNWHRPRGLDDKVRRCIKGWPAAPSVGYGSPRLVRNVHPSGLEEVQVHNIGDLSIIDPETQSARISRTVGARKRNAIVEEALRRNIRVLNPGKSRRIIELMDVEKEPGEAEEAGETSEGETDEAAEEDRSAQEDSEEERDEDQ